MSKQETLPTPTCVGFIMDGNRRWAREQNLPTLEGHRKGVDTVFALAAALKEAHIPHGVFYGFSTENWNRSTEEVAYLMGLFEAFLEKALADAKENEVRFRIIGDRDRFSENIQKIMARVEEETAHYTETTLWFALSYGGRTEIVQAVNKAIAQGELVTEESFAKLLYTAEMPDPDLIIRTSGEQRLSNFLPWQSVYSEFFFTDTYWPDFGKEALYGILEAYGTRKRRKGK